MPNPSTVIDQTKKWLSTVVIEHTLCPFAKREFDTDRIHYDVIAATEIQVQLEHIIMHCAALDQDPTIETSLLIFPTTLYSFEDYLEMFDIAKALLKAQKYEGIYQLASFHPDYCFEGLPTNDPSHYTNRSPYPMVHILREASLEAALKNYPNPEKIPERNIELTQAIGLTVMQKLLAECYK